tara:strand:+ start:7601 stop:8608 length:1008 start_codon:yes stop_codon:yes gene_type:complete
MALTFIEYTADGNNNKNFTFPSITTTDVDVKLDGALQTAGTHYNIVNYTPTGGGTVEFTTGNIPSSPVIIRIARSTDVGSPRVTYTPGSSVKAADLNENALQTIYSLQEEKDAVQNLGGTLSNVTISGNLNVDSNRITNVADGISATDGVNKQQVEDITTNNNTVLAGHATTATTQAAAAASSAATAATEATNALAQANAAAASAITAQSAGSNMTAQVNDANKYASNPANTAFTTSTGVANQFSALHYAQLANSYAGFTVFYGFSRSSTGVLQLTYATASNTATYAVKDYEYKGEAQWLIGDSAALHSATSGGTQGTPRYSLNSSGHLILNTTA